MSEDTTALSTEVSQFAAYAGEGFENVDSECVSLPFFNILQKMSPQCDADHSLAVDGAKAGMFYNSVTNALYDGDEGVLVVPCYFRRVLMEYAQQEQGGGFRGAHEPGTIKATERNEKGQPILKNGNLLVDTHTHFLLVLESDDDLSRVIFSLRSTQLRKSRQWIAQMQQLKEKLPDGKRFVLPPYAHIYRLQTVGESNDRGSWRGIRITNERKLDLTQLNDRIIFDEARGFRELVKSDTSIAVSPDGTDTTENDDIPF